MMSAGSAWEWDCQLFLGPDGLEVIGTPSQPETSPVFCLCSKERGQEPRKGLNLILMSPAIIRGGRVIESVIPTLVQSEDLLPAFSGHELA